MRFAGGALLALLLSAIVQAGVVHDLDPAAVHVVTPGSAECFESSFASPVTNDPLCPIRAYAACGSGGEVDLSVTSCITLRAANGGAHGHYQYWFRVNPSGNALPATPTFVPIHIFAPDVIWDLKLSNGAVSEDAGTSSASFFLRLRSDPADDLQSRGTVVSQTPVVLAAHGGIRGCLSIPTGIDDVANLALSCLAATDQIQQGKASPSIAAVVEVGRTYNVELAMDLKAEKRATVKPTGLYVGTRNDINDPPGPLGSVLQWNKLVISIGTSNDNLQSQIDDLQEQIDTLRGNFDGHSHSYLTGRGSGHNNTGAITGLPAFSGTGGSIDDADGDGITDAMDICPNSPVGERVDAEGCTIGEFCMQYSDRQSCHAGDWLADESNRPRDCRWNRIQASCMPR
jgi:hypothetical protein